MASVFVVSYIIFAYCFQSLNAFSAIVQLLLGSIKYLGHFLRVVAILIIDFIGVRHTEQLCNAIRLHGLVIVDEGQANVLCFKCGVVSELVAEYEIDPAVESSGHQVGL